MIRTVRSFPQRIMHSLVLLLALSLLYGCGAVGGGQSSSVPTAKRLSVTVAPLAADVRAGDTLKFSATVSSAAGTTPGRALGPVTKKVIWSINGIPGGNAALGTINADGLYNSPSIPPSFNSVEVTATSVAEPSVSQTALLTLYNPIPTVTSVTPSKVSVGAFTLTVSGRSFVKGAQVLFAGNSLPTTFTSSKQLVATGVAHPAGKRSGSG